MFVDHVKIYVKGGDGGDGPGHGAMRPGGVRCAVDQPGLGRRWRVRSGTWLSGWGRRPRNAAMVKYYKWRVLDPLSPSKRNKWFEPAWAMTEPEAIKWREAHPRSSIEVVEHSETTKTGVSGGHGLNYPDSRKPNA